MMTSLYLIHDINHDKRAVVVALWLALLACAREVLSSKSPNCQTVSDNLLIKNGSVLAPSEKKNDKWSKNSLSYAA